MLLSIGTNKACTVLKNKKKFKLHIHICSVEQDLIVGVQLSLTYRYMVVTCTSQPHPLTVV